MAIYLICVNQDGVGNHLGSYIRPQQPPSGFKGELTACTHILVGKYLRQMYLCLYTYLYVSLPPLLHTYMCIYIHIYLYIHVCIYIYMTHVCPYVCLYVCRVPMSVCVYARISIDWAHFRSRGFGVGP